MNNDPKIPTREYCERRAVECGCVAEYGTKFWDSQQKYHWQSRFPLKEQWQHWIANAQPHERLPTPPTAEQAAERHLIPPEVWYKQHLEEEARKERERIAREGDPIPMPEHMRRKKPLSRR